eukprot:RCo029120
MPRRWPALGRAPLTICGTWWVAFVWVRRCPGEDLLHTLQSLVHWSVAVSTRTQYFRQMANFARWTGAHPTLSQLTFSPIDISFCLEQYFLTLADPPRPSTARLF